MPRHLVHQEYPERMALGGSEKGFQGAQNKNSRRRSWYSYRIVSPEKYMKALHLEDAGFFIISSYTTPMRQDTLVFLLKPETEEILLAMKKRGFGEGKFNGVGGKVTPGEMILAAAVREAKEEIGVDINPVDLVKVAELRFTFEGKPDWSIHCHTVFCTK